jgi:Flp pilus assembly protein TadD
MTTTSIPPVEESAEATKAVDEGVRHHWHGRLAEAEACYRRALTLRPAFPEALSNLGVLEHGRGEWAAAERHLRDALALKPEYAQAHNNLGNTLLAQSRREEAESCYRKALVIKPDYPEAHLNLGIVLTDFGRSEEAATIYRQAFALKPDMTEALINLCVLLERTHQIDELRERLAGIGDSQVRSTPPLAAVKAKLLRRDKKMAEALELLKGVDPEVIARSIVAPELLAVQGDLHDRMGEYDQAYECSVRGNALALREFERHGAHKDDYLRQIRSEAGPFTGDRVAAWTRPAYAPVRLAFLVGFPRSGTTLLDSILRSHPDVDVVEEQPMVARLREALDRHQSADPHYLDRLDARQLESLRKTYLDELALHRDPTRPAALVIDKLPLTIANAGVIGRVFPEARFILALRDPRDCVLSCFMQAFGPNAAMANFLTLKDAANLYAEVMQLWQRYAKTLDLQSHQVRYEDILEEFGPTVSALLDFLGLPWNDDVARFQQTATKRQMIRTPSYHQVVQPLYKRASGRWLHYQRYMQEVLPVLQPWVNAYGYGE